MDTYADDAFEVVKKLDLKNAVHIGHSTGGGEVTRYVARDVSQVSDIGACLTYGRYRASSLGHLKSFLSLDSYCPYDCFNCFLGSRRRSSHIFGVTTLQLGS
jgi:hypothetical protein